MDDAKRVVIIGLDGFSWNIGNRLIKENYMPFLTDLREKGCHGNLQSVIPYETCPAWASFQTGCLPPKTGVLAFHAIDSDFKKISLNNFDNIQVPSIWEIASDAGKKVISINLPMTCPPPKINGIIIPGLTCPKLSSETVYPPSIYAKYIKNNPDYRIVNKERQDSLGDYVNAAARN